jgi:hypothetical protein
MDATRWWENYLVRYLMPSIAGVAIVAWLSAHAGDDFRVLLLLPRYGATFDAPALTLAFLYGNLFCYIASYPVLSFHVTRVLDFDRTGAWPKSAVLDGYLVTILITSASFIVALFVRNGCRYWAAFLLVTFLAVIQIWRMYLAMSHRIAVDGLAGRVSLAYGFLYALARRRGIPEEIETRTGPAIEPIDPEDVNMRRRIKWRPEFIETYRHLREHGNSAFIFLLELTLAGLVYCVITRPGLTARQQLSSIGVLFAVWALPSIFVHLLGQHLERRFSWFDRRVATASKGGGSGTP